MNVSLLRNRNFVLFVTRESISLSGTLFLNVSLALYTLAATGSAASFASVLALGIIPQLVLGPFAGTLVDRADKRRLLMWLDSGRGLLLLLFFLVSSFMPVRLEMIYVIVLLFAAGDIFVAPASLTLLQRIVRKQDLTHANALDTTVVETVRVLAPFAGTVVYSWAGLHAVFLVGGILCCLCGAAAALIRVEAQRTAGVSSTILQDMRSSLQPFTRDARIRSLVINGMLTHLFLFPFILVGFPYMIKQLFLGSDTDFGLVESMMTAGSLCSLAAVMFLQKRYSLSANIGIGILGMLLFVCPLLFLQNEALASLLGQSPWLVVAFFGGIGFLLFFSFGTYGVFFRTFYQQTVDSSMLGRFVSVMAMLFSISRFFGFALYGRLFDSDDLLVPVVILGIGMVLKLLVHLPFLRAEKRLAAEQHQLEKADL
ncbi:MFS transporter [Brevibacillus ruminantium]|uniref:MFS transporter n=1 Tax=Brevibacillus ruminantium TaxID=2950604 RepID=A0ABY4WBC1_9BACL|nr:MFS transporter [Brevibacillus ruminantium]USG64476.1 MFS transporter [Brevibacillus ruminantium]